MNVGTGGRTLAGCIAAAAWAGLVVQFAALHRANSVILSLWIMFGFFTILTNLLVAVVFSCLASNRGPLRSDSMVAGTMLSILLVGIVNALLLWGVLELSGVPGWWTGSSTSSLPLSSPSSGSSSRPKAGSLGEIPCYGLSIRSSTSSTG